MYHTIDLRIPYADTDQMGMVYYANYLVYFERGRTELLRDAGLTYADIEKAGVYLPVLESHCRYVKSARYDDVVTVASWIAGPAGATLKIQYRITRGSDELAFGHTLHTFINKEGKPVRPPRDVAVRLKELVHQGEAI